MKIGITGGIGSGKSEVTKYLRSKGETVICADEVAKLVVKPGESGAQAIKRAFGDEYFNADGELNRKKLASYVFSDKERIKKLNSILHPIIIEKINELANGIHGKVFIDAALLIEAGMQNSVDYVWLISADVGKRVKRVKKRDKAEEQSIMHRMENQMSEKEMLPFADEVIINNSSLKALHNKIDELLSTPQYSEGNK